MNHTLTPNKKADAMLSRLANALKEAKKTCYASDYETLFYPFETLMNDLISHTNTQFESEQDRITDLDALIDQFHSVLGYKLFKKTIST